MNQCRFCKTELTKRHQKIFCSNQCQAAERSAAAKQKLIKTGEDNTANCKIARRYILETRGHKCQICNRTKWLGQPIPLTLDHINGNPNDNSLDNLRVICANCDRLTSTFGARNRGNGRHWRRERYQAGKSY